MGNMRALWSIPFVVISAVGCAMGPGDEPGAVVVEAKPGAHFVGDAFCVVEDESLTCVGTVAGLGNRAVSVEIDVETTCTNRGNHQPGGLAHGESGPIAPENGRIDFEVTVDSNCPDQMTVGFTSPAALTILQGNTVVFTATIAF